MDRAYQHLRHVRRLLYWILRVTFGRPVAARFLGVKVGAGCRIYTDQFGTEPWLITLGDRVTVAAETSFLTHDGATWLVRDAQGRRYYYAPIVVGNDVFIGIKSIILPGVRVGSRVVVGAGSVVTRSVPDGVVVAGNPARILGKYEDYHQRILALRPAADEMQGKTYRARVDIACDSNFRPPLSNSGLGVPAARHDAVVPE